MITKGPKFKYYLDNESTTYADILNSPKSNFTVTVDGFDIYYSTPQSAEKGEKTEKILQQAEKSQKQNGGRLDLDSLVYAFELRDQPVTEAHKKFYDVCYSKISDKLQETLIDRHANGETHLPKEFQAVAADVDKFNALEWEQMSKFSQIPFDIEKYLESLTGERSPGRKDSLLTGAKKEAEGKLFYELDFNFVRQMAERMQSNKDNSKYDMWNWKKPMTPKGLEDLKQAMWRHIIAVMEGEMSDDGREFGHLEAISNNAMMICYQLRNNL